MTKQSKAQQLIDSAHISHRVGWQRGAVAELRRLDEVNAQLLEALEDLLQDTQHDDHICEDLKWCPVVKARAAIAAAREET
jgi:hypothetical protein